MNQENMKRLRALEEQVAIPDEGFEFFREEVDEDGFVTHYVLLRSGRTLTIEEFDELVARRTGVAFVPIQPPTDDAEADAYWKYQEAPLSVTWADLQAENAGGPVAFDPEAWVREADEGTDDEELNRARRYLDRLDEGEPFWEEMKRRSAQLGNQNYI